MLWVNLPVVDMIHSKCNKFVTGVKIKATGPGDSKFSASPAFLHVCVNKVLILVQQ